jgi:hypothetical protein
MIYLLYLIFVPINLLTTIAGVILAPILPAFAKNGWLPTWLNWFQTPDNWLYGDLTFMSLHKKNYWSEILWLWRNPAYGFAVKYLSFPFVTTFVGDKTIKDNDNAKAGWCFVKANGLFQFVYIKRIFSTSRCIYVNCGWNIRGLVDDNVSVKPNPYQATFSFSPRISGFR